MFWTFRSPSLGLQWPYLIMLYPSLKNKASQNLDQSPILALQTYSVICEIAWQITLNVYMSKTWGVLNIIRNIYFVFVLQPQKLDCVRREQRSRARLAGWIMHSYPINKYQCGKWPSPSGIRNPTFTQVFRTNHAQKLPEIHVHAEFTQSRWIPDWSFTQYRNF